MAMGYYHSKVVMKRGMSVNAAEATLMLRELAKIITGMGGTFIEGGMLFEKDGRTEDLFINFSMDTRAAKEFEDGYSGYGMPNIYMIWNEMTFRDQLLTALDAANQFRAGLADRLRARFGKAIGPA